MRRILLFSFATIVLGCISGCGSGYGGGGGGQIVPPNALDGQYAFVLSGYDSTGAPLSVAGSITADGHGYITSGSVDLNDNAMISSNSGALAGSYTLDSNLRGVIAITNTIGSVTHPLAFAFTLRTDGTSGDIIGLDTNGFVLTGTMQKQDPTAFSLSILAGNFAFEIDANSTGRRVVDGRFTLDQNGMGTNGLSDASLAGTGPTATGLSLSFTFAAAGPNANGRGMVTSTDASNSTASFVYYIVSAGKILVLRTDPAPAPPMTGVVIRQNMPFSTATVNTGGAVFALTGVDVANNPTNDISAIGQLQVTSAMSGVLNWDSNDAGTIVGPTTISNPVITFDPSTGRGTITVANGTTNGLFDKAVFYLLDSGKGFILDTSAGANNRALAGTFQPQTGVGSFGLSTFTNKMILRAGGTSPNNAGTLDGLLSLGSNSTFALTLDARTPGLADIVNQTLNGLQISAIDATTGRGMLTIPGTSFNASEAIYIVGPNQFVMIDVTPSPNNFATPILFFDPQ